MKTELMNRPKNIIHPQIIQNQIKRVLVKYTGGTKQPQEALIGPGTTADDLLNHLGLSAQDFNLSRGTGDSIFGMKEPLYDKIIDGDLLFVTSRVDAGN